MSLFRVHHIAFAIAVAVAYFTSERLGLVHAWTGYVIAGLFFIRLALGWARQRGFGFTRLSPSLRRVPERFSGLRHPAIGNALTLALLATVCTTAATGIAMDRGGTLVGQSIRENGDEDEGEDGTFSLGIITPAHADEGNEEEGGEDEEGPLSELHETLGNLVLFLALAHIGYMLAFRWPLSRHLLFGVRRS